MTETHKLIITFRNTMGGDTLITRTGTMQECVEALATYARLDASVGPQIITEVAIRPMYYHEYKENNDGQDNS